MGIHALVRNKKKSSKVSKLNKWHRAKKAERKKRMPPPTINIEDAHLFSVDKLKNKLRNPRNNIAISGKKRQRLTKRLRHSLREKSAMEVEITLDKPSKKKPISQSDDVSDEIMQDVNDMEEQSVDIAGSISASSSSSSSSKKKKRGKRKGSKGAKSASSLDVDMEED